MTLNPSQYAAVKTLVDNTPAMAEQPNTPDGNFEVARLMNLVATPNFFVWKSTVSMSSIVQAPGFDWSRVDNLTDAKARVFEWMLLALVVSPAATAVRGGWLQCFATAGDIAMRLAIGTIGQRLASVVEKTLASGVGTTTTDQFTGPAIMGFEGPISYIDVGLARSS